MKKLINKTVVYEDTEKVEIKVFRKDSGAPYEIRIGNDFWTTCEDGITVNEEIKDIISIYNYSYFPMI